MKPRRTAPVSPLDGAFRQRVYDIVRLVPHGRITTYGFVSTLAGAPRHARQVGWALHTLPDALVWGAATDLRRDVRREGSPIDPDAKQRAGRVPWHRVVNAKGQVSTHPDEAGTYRQIDLLRQEGIEVTDSGVLVGGLSARLWVPDSAVVDGLELPADVLYDLDRQLDR